MIKCFRPSSFFAFSTAFLLFSPAAQAQFVRPFSTTPLPSTMLQSNGQLGSAGEFGTFQPQPALPGMLGAGNAQNAEDKAVAEQQRILENTQNLETGAEPGEACTRAKDEPPPARDMTYGGNAEDAEKKDPCKPKPTKAESVASNKSLPHSPSPLKTGSPVSGEAQVISGDTLKIGGTLVHLAGIESPPPGEVCRSGATAWRCGDEATTDLQEVADHRHLTCTIQAEKSELGGLNMPDASCGGSSGIADLSIFQASRGNALGTTPETKIAMRSAKLRHSGIWLSQ
ncbi:hypothetical protein AD930_02350 [Acetobacter malorum]|nr:hypothetical protein AD930_02350 [Acetobacter malorum]